MPATSPTPTPSRALAAWRQACIALGARLRTPRETVALAEAAGRVTAEPVLALRPAPAFDSAAMDGIAIRADDVAGACPNAPVVLTSRQFEMVDTGDPVPAGFDAVIAREHVRHGADGEAIVAVPLQTGRHVRRVGEDVRAGEPLFPAGHRLRPVDLAVAAATGSVLLSVHQIPHVAVIPTGDELRPAGSVLAPGQVVESNSLMLAGQARELGCRATIAPIVPDCPAAIAEAVRHAARTADLVVVIAGGGGGRDDYTARVFADLGSLIVHGVAVRPGHPVCLGVVDEPRVPLLGVPGYPVAAALGFDLFAKPMLAALAGQRPYSFVKAMSRGRTTGSPMLSAIRECQPSGMSRGLPRYGLPS